MKNLSPLLLLLCSLFASPPILAQIRFTTSDVLNMYAVGKGQRQIGPNDSVTFTMNVGVASASQAQTWSLPTTQYPDTFLFTNVTPSSTPYGKDFPLATHAQRFSEVDTFLSFTGYDYIRIANDSLVFIGSALTSNFFGTDTTEYDSIPQFIFKMPLILGTVLTSRDSSYNDPGDYTITNSTTTFDAFGTITLPNGSFQCLRSTEVNVDENHVGAFVTRDTTVGLSWVTEEGHIADVTAVNNSQTSGNIYVNELSVTELVSVTTGVPDRQTTAPNTFALLQNFPNPFNPSTTFSFSLPSKSPVSLKVFDALGREVSVVLSEELPAGNYSRQWNAADLPSGMYFYRLQAGTFTETKKLLLLK